MMRLIIPPFDFRVTEQGEVSSDRLTPSLETEDSNSNASDSRSVSSVCVNFGEQDHQISINHLKYFESY